MNNMQLRRLNHVKNKIIINLKMFHAKMKDMISGEISGTKVVREHGRQGLHWDKKFQQQQFHPLQFSNSSRNSTILSLSGRMSNNSLLCKTSGDWISTKEYKKSTYGGMIFGVTRPVCIRESMQCLMGVGKKPYIEGSRAIKITKQTFDRSSMVFEWRVHKLREFIHNKGNIWSSHPKMLGATTNHLTVRGGIDRCSSIMSS